MDLGIRVRVIASKVSFLWHQAGPGGKHLKAKVKRLLIGFEKLLREVENIWVSPKMFHSRSA